MYHHKLKGVLEHDGAGEQGDGVGDESRARIHEDAREHGQDAIGNHVYAHELVLHKCVGDEREDEEHADEEQGRLQMVEIVAPELAEVVEQ